MLLNLMDAIQRVFFYAVKHGHRKHTEKQLWLSLAYYHLVLPHTSLQERLPAPEPTRGAGSPRQWRLVTPAMAAGMTDHVWTTSELLAYRVPAEFLDQLPAIEHLFPEWDMVHHSN